LLLNPLIINCLLFDEFLLNLFLLFIEAPGVNNFHGVSSTCSGFVYSFSAALLDINTPSKVLYRAGGYMLTPEAPYETTGFVPNVTFPCAALHDEETGRLAVYYGCADSVTGLAFGYVPEIVRFTKENSII